jgi:methyl-accepting chemotaxis protein
MITLIKYIYIWLEKTFFNTNNRKNSGNILLLTQIFSISIFITHDYHQTINRLVMNGGTPELAASVAEASSRSMQRMITLHLFGAAVFFCLIFFLRHLIVRPVKMLFNIFANLDWAKGDLSAEVPAISHDEFRQLTENYNTFLAMLRNVFLTLRQQSVNIAVNSAIVANKVSVSARHAEQHNNLSD